MLNINLLNCIINLTLWQSLQFLYTKIEKIIAHNLFLKTIRIRLKIFDKILLILLQRKAKKRKSADSIINHFSKLMIQKYHQSNCKLVSITWLVKANELKSIGIIFTLGKKMFFS